MTCTWIEYGGNTGEEFADQTTRGTALHPAAQTRQHQTRNEQAANLVSVPVAP